MFLNEFDAVRESEKLFHNEAHLKWNLQESSTWANDKFFVCGCSGPTEKRRALSGLEQPTWPDRSPPDIPENQQVKPT